MGDRCNCPPFFDRDIESDINDLLGRSELVVLRAVKIPNLEKSSAVFDNRKDACDKRSDPCEPV